MKGRCTISFIGPVRSVMPLISRGFHGRRRTDVEAARVPPGQYADKASRYCRPVPRRACRSTGGWSPWTGPVGQSRSLAIAPISRGRFVGYSPSEKASPHSAAGVDAGTTVPGHPVPGPGRDASWEPRRRAIETVDSAGGQGTAPTSSGVGRPRWASLRPNTKGQ
jgi:hypothetical protein